MTRLKDIVSRVPFTRFVRISVAAVAAATAAGVLGAGAVAHATADHPEDCRTRGRTIAANADARIFARDNRSVTHVYYACDVKRRKTRELGRWDRGEGGVSPHFGLSGRSVLYEYIQCVDTSAPCTGHVDVLDVRTNRRRFVAQFPGPPQAPPASDLLLSPSGTAVWIRPGASGPTVTKVDASGTALLDPGPDVAAGSLALAGNRFYWTRGGVAQIYDAS